MNSGSARLRRAIKRHSPGVHEDRPPSLKRTPPNPDGSLLLRVDLGRADRDTRLLVLVQPHHTFADLAGQLVEALFDDTGHLCQFWVHPDGHVMQGFYDEGPEDALKWWNGNLVVMDAWDGDCAVYRVPDVRTIDGDQTTVTSRLGVGWFAWFRFDFGDEWWFAIRAVAPVPARARQPLPEILAYPLREIVQYRDYD